MEDKGFSIGKLIFWVTLGLIFSIILIFFFKKFMILENKIFYIIIFGTGLLVLLFWIIHKLSSSINMNPSNNYKKNRTYYYERINSLLSEMPTPDLFVWNKGTGARIDTREFSGRQYIGIIGDSENARRMLVIYDIEEDDIVRYIGDPPPRMEMDVFYGFQPRHTDRSQMLKSYYESLKYQQSDRGNKIYIGGDKNIPKEEELDDEQEREKI